MSEKSTSARAIVIKNGNVLLLHVIEEGHEYYVVPGGKLEPNETPEEAVIREVYEETCVKIADPKLIKVLNSVEKIQMIFHCSYVDSVPMLGKSPEEERLKAEPIWLPTSQTTEVEISPKIVADTFREVIMKV